MIRRRLRQVLFRLLFLSGIPFLLREIVQRRRVTVILYHDIRPALAAAHFRALRRRYRVIPLREYLDALRDGRVHELPRKSLVITFDDGHRGNHALIPVLEELAVPVTIFLCSRIVGTNRHFWFLHDASNGRIEELKSVANDERERRLGAAGFDRMREWPKRRALSRDEVREMLPFVDFQAHTMFHPILPRCADAEARAEIEDAKSDLEELLGRSVTTLSYPNGFYSDRDIELAKQAGYDSGITVDLGYNDAKTDSFLLNRICIDDSDDVGAMLVKATGLWTYLRNRIKGPGYGRVSANRGE